MGQRQEGGLSGSHRALNNLYELRAGLKQQQDLQEGNGKVDADVVRWEMNARILKASTERVTLALVNVFMAHDQ